MACTTAGADGCDGVRVGGCMVAVRCTSGAAVGACPFASNQRMSLYASWMNAFMSSGWQPFIGRLAPSGKRAKMVARLTALPPPFSCLSSSTSAIDQLLIVTLLHRCENAWCALLQSEHTKILYFMQTSLKPMRSSYGHDPHTLFAARRRSAFSALSGSGAMVGNEMHCHCWPQRARPKTCTGGGTQPPVLQCISLLLVLALWEGPVSK